MDDVNRKIYISEAEVEDNFDLEDILAEYREQPEKLDDTELESLADRSKKFVIDRLGEEYDSTGMDSLDDVIANAVAESTPQPTQEKVADSYEASFQTGETENDQDLSIEQEVLIEELQASAGQTKDKEIDFSEVGSDADALSDTTSKNVGEIKEKAKKRANEGKNTKVHNGSNGKFLSPIVAVMALIALRKGQKQKTVSERNTSVNNQRKLNEEKQIEMEPGKAARRCVSLMNSLRTRGRIATVLCIVMVYISYAVGSSLPLTGALKSSCTARALLLLIMELTVIMSGLDIFTEGIVSIVRRKPSARSLVSVSCVLSIIDAVIIGLGNTSSDFPFCAVSALSLTFSMWGEFFNCAGNRTGYRVLTSSKNVYSVTGENGLANRDVSLLKSKGEITDFVSRCTYSDYNAKTFRIMSPVLIIASFVLGAIASFGHGTASKFFHYFSALSAASATFSATLSFTMPYAIAARCLARSGAAVAGWAGVRDVGNSRHVVITDSDLFPKGTVEIGNVRILEGAFVDKVISYTGSVIVTSGSGLAEPFFDLIRRNGYTVSHVENFEPHDGGGLTAVVNGDTVCIGNSGFMNLMGIRVPRKISAKNSVYTAINGTLVGIFSIEYRATGGVQGALVTLLHSNLEPIFAIRDFNITPQLIKTKFRLPTDDYSFPAYGERFRISGAEPNKDSHVAAAIVREGMGPLVDIAERGRRLYTGVRAGTLIAAVGGVFGVLLVFLLCWSGSFDNASVGNVITFMLLWLIPTAVIVWGIQR